MEYSFKSLRRAAIKCHKTDIFYTDIGVIQAPADRINRKIRIMFFTGKPFFLRSGNNPPVPQKTSRAVMIKTRNSQYIAFIHEF
jgi:hypothetical protein